MIQIDLLRGKKYIYRKFVDFYIQRSGLNYTIDISTLRLYIKINKFSLLLIFFSFLGECSIKIRNN